MRKLGGLAPAGLGVDGWATTQATTQTARSTPDRPAGPARAPLNLAPVRASFERVIRTTVGVRPHRDSGFVLKAEKFDAKTVFHDSGMAAPASRWPGAWARW